jgi:hypothetical protein
MFKVEASTVDADHGIIAVRLLSHGGKVLAMATLHATLLDEMGAALAMTQEKLVADGVIQLGPPRLELKATGNELMN